MKSMGHCIPMPRWGAVGARRSAITLTLALLSALLLSMRGAEAAAASTPECASRAMYIVAHEDDSLLFQSPDLLQDIRSGRCVRTVFLTAGDDGKPEEYWIEREAGAEAGYARMAEVADAWEPSSIQEDGHPIRLETLEAEPRVTLVFMRLPDGGYPAGEGFSPRFESLMKLWNGAESSITAVDGSTTYDYQGLIETLTAMMTSFQPQWIATQNYNGTFGDGDHPDHVATAKFTQAAQDLYTAPHQLIGYEDYETSSEEANVSPALLIEKEAAFTAYSEYDEVCTEGSECETEYERWLERQYVAGTETTGVVANAGYAQTVNSGESVELDGSHSSAEAGDLTYEWTQIAGPSVELGNATSEAPSFVAPSAAASLSFSLTVSDGTETSAPNVVHIRVEGSNPTPTAVSGEAQSVASGETVTLDGSHSLNPYGQPLEYEWTQTSGPPVSLAGALSAKPTFTAPWGPASLVFSLVVTNAATSSAPSTVTVTVSKPKPEPTAASPPAGPSTSQTPGGDPDLATLVRLSRHEVKLLAHRRSHRVISVFGPPFRRVWCTGRLPRGVHFRVVDKDRIVLESARRTKRVGVYRLTVHVVSQMGTVDQRALAVDVLYPPKQVLKSDVEVVQASEARRRRAS